MRLRCVETEHSLRNRLRLALMGFGSRRRAPDVVKLFLHRPELFGAQAVPVTQRVMRGPSSWSVGERELFAAFVSVQNQCPF
ncbi:MAG: hypothetical protein E6I76_11170 [Chloroflexi bacterium]|nr:MAG: hypothetical protein E6J03_04645 [Chloroflexota bacterium]TMD95144.1 MAG: hypothetical protein E6I76_11170 [Chloroflexota bacterium]